MRTAFDFTPLFRSSTDFDRIADLLENASRVATIDNWPPYDIAKTGEDDYRLTVAVAGFSEDELTITQEPNMLLASGEKSGENDGQYLHRGIARRAFQRRFDLADHVKVARASLMNGMLTITLKHEIPEEMKQRRIEVSSRAPMPKTEAPKVKAEKLAA